MIASSPKLPPSRPPRCAPPPHADAIGDAASLTDGYSAAFIGAAIVAAAGALIAATTLRTPRPAQTVADSHESELAA